jgi:hypothetical protein
MCCALCYVGFFFFFLSFGAVVDAGAFWSSLFQVSMKGFLETTDMLFFTLVLRSKILILIFELLWLSIREL